MNTYQKISSICLAGVLVYSLSTSANAADTDKNLITGREKDHALSSLHTIFIPKRDVVVGKSEKSGRDIHWVNDSAVEIDMLQGSCLHSINIAPISRRACEKNVRKALTANSTAGGITAENTGPDPLTIAASLIPSSSPQASSLKVQPSKGWALVNVPSIFWVENTNTPVSMSSTLGEGEVTWIPAYFTYSYGDGEEFSTVDTGAAYPNHTITHKYKKTGIVQAQVKTWWDAQVNVNGNVFMFRNAAETTSEPLKLEVLKTRQQLQAPN